MKNEICSNDCLICKKEMKNKISSWAFFCANCQYWKAILKTNITSQSDAVFDAANEDEDILEFLNDVRLKNFNEILDVIDSENNNANKNLKILDIGCATGLFMQTASHRGYNVLGIEPNLVMAKKAIEKGCAVNIGYFPEALDENIKFDVIIFNDVFEHIPDLKKTIINCIQFLNHNGMLIINAPTSDGFLFKAAKILAALGIQSPWNRLWQTMFYTPHLHYLNNFSLAKLLEKYQLRCIYNSELNSIGLKNLWKRLSVDKTASSFKKIISFLSVLAAYPILKISKKDTFFAIYRLGINDEN